MNSSSLQDAKTFSIIHWPDFLSRQELSELYLRLNQRTKIFIESLLYDTKIISETVQCPPIWRVWHSEQKHQHQCENNTGKWK